MGSNINTLWGVISGHNAVKPYTYVAFRVIARIADILDRKFKPDEPIDPYNEKTSEKIQEKLFATFQLSLEKKIQKESGHEWFEDYNDFEQ
jgi:non-homologous end joining protein Ku